MYGAEWVSQRVPPLGAITSEGIRKQLGRPRLDRLTVLVRESAQNSWDAGDPTRSGPVRYSIDLLTLAGERLEAWRGVAEGAPDAGTLGLGQLLAEETPLLLCISDRGTTGLGGPTRADAPVVDSRDYVSFVLNVGVPRDTDFGGGTYGFGKTSLYTASRANTVMVSTRCRVEGGRTESRLVGCALGHSDIDSDRNLTGRHWWGVSAGDGDAVEPLRNEDAEWTARALGLPGFAPDETGTTVAVVAPELDGRRPEEVVERLVETILIHLWPKMMEDDGGTPEMEFAVSLDDGAVEMPHPRDHPVTRLFCDSWDHQRDPSRSSLLECRSPVQALGRLGLTRGFFPPPVVSEIAREAGLSTREEGVAEALHHVCLVRRANLVVRYLEGPPMPDDYVSYAGFFRPELELDDVYALSEPPTHDDWVAAQLDGRDKTFVNTTFARIREALRSFTAPAEVEPEDGEVVALGAASHLLAGLITRGSGTGVSALEKVSTGGGSGGASTVRLLGSPYWESLGREELLMQDVEVARAEGVAVEPVLRVAVWGSGRGEGEAPAGSRAPVFRGWIDPEGRLSEGPVVEFGRSSAGTWRMLVDPPDDAMVEVGIRRVRTGDAR